MNSRDSTTEPAWTPGDLARDPHQTADKADRVQRMFESIAHAYDLNNRLHSFGRDQSWRRRAVELARVTPADDVLDVACGTGDLTIAFSRAGCRSVTGIDFTPAMLDIARRKADRAVRDANIRFDGGDATRLHFDDASFNVVSIAFGLRNVSRPDDALCEFHRVMRSGGRLVVLDFSKPRNRLVAACNRFYTHRLMPISAGLIARDRSGAYRYLPRSVETFAEGEEMRRAIREAGFQRVESHAMTLGVCTLYLGYRP